MEKLLRFVHYACLAALLLTAFSWQSAESGTPQSPVPSVQPYAVFHDFVQPEKRFLADTSLNVITDSSEVLVPFMEKLAALQSGADSVISILHIGDSHVQAGFLTGRLMELFQSDFGNAGRGLIIPYKLAMTNEPRDYSINTLYGRKTKRATEKEIGGKLGFTGVAVSMETPYNEFKIWSLSPFSAITVFHHKDAPMLHEPDDLAIGSYCTADNTLSSTRIVLSRQVDSLTLHGVVSKVYDNPTFYGFSLDNGSPGILYHSVGINGASFEHFAWNTTITEGGAAALDPDLIVISLGTNNCFGNNFRREQFYGVVDKFFREIGISYPGVPVIAVTPMESCNRRSVRGRRTYVPNPNIPVAAEAIVEAAAANGAASLDFYAAAGGEGSMAQWHAGKLANDDRVHLNENGYFLQADIMYEAFMKYYNNYINTQRGWEISGEQ